MRFMKSVIFGILLAFFSANTSFAMTVLKQVQVTPSGASGTQVDLLFDGKIRKNQISTEYINNIVQINLNDVAVYPAKIANVHAGDVTKIFAYQYSPNLVRCRLTVNGKADNYRGKIKINPSGKILTIQFASQAASQAESLSDGERAILDRVLSSKPVVRVAAAAEPAHAPVKQTIALGKTVKPTSPSLASGKPMPGFFQMFWKLLFVLAVFGMAVVAMKRFKIGKDTLSKGLGRAFGGKEKMIEVLATHYLGPKKNIAVIRVFGRKLVIGITNESINLIARLDHEEEVDTEELADDLMGAALSGPSPAVAKPAPTFSQALGGAAAAYGSNTTSISKIRSKLEGLKQL